MKKRVYWKDIGQSFLSSKGRFLSILTLMLLGSMALVGLKVATPNMRRTAVEFIRRQKVMDLTVIADYGLDEADQKELTELEGAEVELAYMTDLTLSDSDRGLRIFSQPENISSFKLIQGRLPKDSKEIALADYLAGDFFIGQEVSFQEAGQLKSRTFKVTGFVQSSEIWSRTNSGQAAAGNGNLDGYGLVSPQAFDADVYSLARIRYRDLRGMDPFSRGYQERLSQHQKELDDRLKDNGQQRLKSLQQSGQAEVDQAKEKLRQSQLDWQQGQEQIRQAQHQLNQQSDQLDQAVVAGLVSPEQEAAQRSQLQGAQSQIQQRQEDLAAAEKKLETSRQNLKETEQALKELQEPAYHSYDRKSLPGGNGYYMYSNASASIDSIGNVFPVLLYLVAAMVTFTTMTRFVDEERTTAGTFKALGYHSQDIIRKFLIYGFLAGSLGALLGIFLGHYFLSSLITKTITKNMNLSETKAFFYPVQSLVAYGLTLISSVLPAYLVARRELKEEAAKLLLPKPPVEGSTILLERLSFLWKRLTFTQKVTVRNIFRYKQRMLMTVFGVAGSVALLFAGLGIQSSIGGVSHRQFKEILKYDLLVTTADSPKQGEEQELQKLLKSNQVSSHEKLAVKILDERLPGQENKESITLMVSSRESLAPFLSLVSVENQRPLNLKEGAVISSKLARLTAAKKKKSIQLDGQQLPLSGINENYFGHFVFMDQKTYEQVYGKKLTENAYLVRLKDSSDKNVRKVAARFMKLPAVRGNSQNISLAKNFHTLADSLSGTMMTLVVISVLLAIVILYNLTNINVAERIRELSTIKVLGFHNKEVTLYIYRETILLTLVGIGSGLLAGFYLHRFLIELIAPSQVAFRTQVGWQVYLLPILTVVLILSFLGLYVNHYLRKVDMLEALKSNE